MKTMLHACVVGLAVCCSSAAAQAPAASYGSKHGAQAIELPMSFRLLPAHQVAELCFHVSMESAVSLVDAVTAERGNQQAMMDYMGGLVSASYWLPSAREVTGNRFATQINAMKSLPKHEVSALATYCVREARSQVAKLSEAGRASLIERSVGLEVTAKDIARRSAGSKPGATK